MWLLRRRIDLARRGAWSAAIRHAPRALGGAVVTKGRAQLIKETFCMGVILTLACLLRRQFTVRGSARVYTSLKCTQMHLHHITLTSPHPIAIGDTSHTFGKPSWFRNVCALLDALQPLLACFPACLLLLLCIVLSREYPGGHPTSDVSRVGT
jgi:hypothetical protein